MALNEWNSTELDQIDAADELDLASVRRDGTLGPYTTIWIEWVGDDFYMRSYRAIRGRFRRALKRHRGGIRVVGIEGDVTLEEP